MDYTPLVAVYKAQERLIRNSRGQPRAVRDGQWKRLLLIALCSPIVVYRAAQVRITTAAAGCGGSSEIGVGSEF
jgi:hypothetical protein